MHQRRREFLQSIGALSALALVPPAGARAADGGGVRAFYDERSAAGRAFANACARCGISAAGAGAWTDAGAGELPAQVHSVIGLTDDARAFVLQQLLAQQGFLAVHRVATVPAGHGSRAPESMLVSWRLARMPA